MHPSRWLFEFVRSLLRQPRVHVHVLLEISRTVTRHRRLLLEMSKREITDQFAGSFFGVAWSILHPLILMFIYVGVFSGIFKARPPDGPGLNPHGFNFTIQMIAAFLPWMAFSSVLARGPIAISNKANLVKQVVFPIEILPLRFVLASLVPQAVGTLFLIGYTLVVYHTLPWTWVLFPLLIVCQLMLLAGLSYLLAAVGVYFRDLKEIAAVAASIGTYITPILYTEYLGAGMGWLSTALKCNPISYYVWPYRDIAFYGNFLHPAAWIALPIGSILVLVGGYRSFRKLKPQFGNAL